MAATADPRTAIEDYAVVGDTRTVALVSRAGSVDWLCWPSFDSAACFAALLGNERNGHWQVAPVDEDVSVTRRYRGHTLVLETTFTTRDGVVRVTDAMSPTAPSSHLARVVEGLEGDVPMRTLLRIRGDYGHIVPWVEPIEGGMRATAGPDGFRMQAPLPLQSDGDSVGADFVIGAGERLSMVLEWHRSHQPLGAGLHGEDVVAAAERWWSEWFDACVFGGELRETVARSLITLKALTFAPTGGIVAAPTTSLPEQLGGVRNWDYRYCWLRDATFTLYALMLAGFTDEAEQWEDWLLRAVAGEPGRAHIMYGLRGERRLPEVTLDWLDGYAGSQPVRSGNAAVSQFQLDTFGEVLDVFHGARRNRLPVDERSWEVQRALVEHVAAVWRDPDHGIWEVRGPRQHFTHSKVMAWVAVDRGVKAVQRHDLDGPLDAWCALRAEIHREVCEKGFDAARNTFVQHYDTTALDASLLMIPLVGFLPPDDPRVIGTVEAIERELTTDGFVRRYATDSGVDGLPGDEGVFLACTFWLVDALWMIGRSGDAEQLFEQLLAVANDVGLLSEQYDPRGRCQLGNFPQALSHIALVNSAWNLAGGRDHPRWGH